MPEEHAIHGTVDPATGTLPELVTEGLSDNPRDYVRTTTTYVEGRKKRRARETFHRPPDDPRARSNLIERETFHYAEDGTVAWREVVEVFGNGVNETPTHRTVTEWNVDPANNQKRWMRFIQHFKWDLAPPGSWVKHTTVELSEDGSVRSISHP